MRKKQYSNENYASAAVCAPAFLPYAVGYSKSKEE